MCFFIWLDDTIILKGFKNLLGFNLFKLFPKIKPFNLIYIFCFLFLILLLLIKVSLTLAWWS